MNFNVDVIVKTIGADKIDELERQIDRLKSENITVNVDLNNKNFQKSFDNVSKQANNVGKQINQSIQSGINSSSRKTTKNTANFFDSYFANKQAITKEADQIAKQYNVSQNEALKAVRAKNNSLLKEEQKYTQQLQNIRNKESASYDNPYRDAYQSIGRKSDIQKQMSDYYTKLEKTSAQEYARVQKAQAKQIESIQRDLSLGAYDAKLSSFSSRLSPYDQKNGNALISKANQQAEIYKNTLTNLKRHFDSNDSFQLNDAEIVSSFNRMDDAAQKFNNTMIQIQNTQSKTLGLGVAERSANEVQKYMNANSKALKKYGADLRDLENQYRSMTTVAQKADLDNKFKNLKSNISAEGLTGKSFMEELGRGFKQIGQFAYTYGAIEQIPEVLERMAQEVIKVDDAMTQMMMATGVNKDQAKDLMSTYSEMGKELKATGVDVATSATEWMKQGKSIEEANALAKDSIILSKIGDLTSEEATSTITAAMKSYDLDETGVMNFIDQISAIDMASATDVGGLATAFNEVAANARNAGIETETVLAYAATIGETTQEGMASVGTSLNSILSRMGNIKLSRLKDPESGEDLNYWGIAA